MHKPPVWPLLLSTILLTGLVLACSRFDTALSTPTDFVVYPSSTEPSPTHTAVPSTATPSITPTPEYSAASLAPEIKKILDFFPLAPGAIWTYQATIDESTGPETIEHWEGTITAAVTGATLEEGFPIFRVEWSGHPNITSPEIGLEYYVVLDTGIYDVSTHESGIELVQAGVPTHQPYVTWPLEVGQEWNGHYEYLFGWYIDAQEPVETPAGLFEDCIKAAIHTNPDHAFHWFCPGAGLVRYEYHHHGSVHDEIRELSSFSPGSTPDR